MQRIAIVVLVLAVNPAAAAPAAHGPIVALRVVDEAGAPIVAARVDTDPPQLTDRDGRTVIITAPDALSTFLAVSARGYASRPLAVDLGRDPAATIAAQIVLSPAVRFGGVVRDERDRPVANAAVSPRAVSPGWADDVRTDSHGRWHIDTFAAGSRVALAVQADCASGGTEQELVVPASPRDDIVLHVAPVGHVDGITVDAAGRPIAGVTVDVAPSYNATVATGSDGRFEARCVDGEQVTVAAHTDRLGTPGQTLTLPRGGHASLRLVMTDSSLAGTVTTPDTVPVGGAKIVITGPTITDTQTDDIGRFDFGGVPPGHYTLEVRRASAPTDSVAAHVEVDTGDRGVAVVVPAVASIRGRVLMHGAPVELLAAAVGSNALALPTPRATPDGWFELDDVPAGDVSVVIGGPHFRTLRLDPVHAAGGAMTDVGEVTVVAGATVRGRVVDTAGKPVAGASVVVDANGMAGDDATAPMLAGDDTSRTHSDRDGRFEIGGLPDDVSRLRIRAGAPGCGLAAPRALTGADVRRDAALALVLHDAGAVAGTIADYRTSDNGNLVVVTPTDASRGYATFASGGRFAIDQLVPGDYRATIYGVVMTPVAFHVAARGTVAVSLPRASAPVQVRIDDHSGTCAGASLRSPDGRETLATSDTCTFDDVVPETYQLCNRDGACKTATLADQPAQQTVVVE